MFLTLRASSSRAPLQAAINSASQFGLNHSNPPSSRKFAKSAYRNLNHENTDRSLLSVTPIANDNSKQTTAWRRPRVFKGSNGPTSNPKYRAKTSGGGQKRQAHVSSSNVKGQGAREELVDTSSADAGTDSTVEEGSVPEPVVQGTYLTILDDSHRN